MLDENTLVERSTLLMQTEVDDELVALDVAGGTCFGFNATAARVWQLAEQPVAIADIVDRLVAEFDVERTECAPAVTALVADLVGRRLLRARPA